MKQITLTMSELNAVTLVMLAAKGMAEMNKQAESDDVTYDLETYVTARLVTLSAMVDSKAGREWNIRTLIEHIFDTIGFPNKAPADEVLQYFLSQYSNGGTSNAEHFEA